MSDSNPSRQGRREKAADRESYFRDLAKVKKELCQKLKGKKASMDECVEWIYNNVGTPVMELENIPSLGALEHLSYIKKNRTKNFETFLRDFAAKRMPTSSQLEAQKRFSDDGRQTFPLIEMVVAELKKNTPTESGS